MFFLTVVHNYLLWHYTRAWREVLSVWRNYLWFVIQFFSIPQLLGSWFSPFKRIVEGRGNTWSLEDLAGYVIIGLMSRFVGAIMRTIIIGLGLLVLAITVVLGIIVLVTWFVAPAGILVLLLSGIVVMFV